LFHPGRTIVSPSADREQHIPLGAGGRLDAFSPVTAGSMKTANSGIALSGWEAVGSDVGLPLTEDGRPVHGAPNLSRNSPGLRVGNPERAPNSSGFRLLANRRRKAGRGGKRDIAKFAPAHLRLIRAMRPVAA
jgi:hypothetical protein